MNAIPPTDWDPEAWGGLSEEEAFAEDPDAVLDQRGKVIAEQTWQGGSWASVSEYNGRFFSQDEVETIECPTALAAFERAGIGRATHDQINHQRVAPEYRHLLADDGALELD